MGKAPTCVEDLASGTYTCFSVEPSAAIETSQGAGAGDAAVLEGLEGECPVGPDGDAPLVVGPTGPASYPPVAAPPSPDTGAAAPYRIDFSLGLGRSVSSSSPASPSPLPLALGEGVEETKGAAEVGADGVADTVPRPTSTTTATATTTPDHAIERVPASAVCLCECSALEGGAIALVQEAWTCLTCSGMDTGECLVETKV